jgi:hypothetical protein
MQKKISDQIVTNGKTDQTGDIMHIQFFHQVSSMSVNRSMGNK